MSMKERPELKVVVPSGPGPTGPDPDIITILETALQYAREGRVNGLVMALDMGEHMRLSFRVLDLVAGMGFCHLLAHRMAQEQDANDHG